LSAPNFVTSPSTVDPEAVRRHQIETVGKACASWFLWLAGLAMVNSVLSSSGAGIRFMFGLGITSIVDAFAHEAGSTSVVLTLVINAFIAGGICPLLASPKAGP
jgi:hypothetical protein